MKCSIVNISTDVCNKVIVMNWILNIGVHHESVTLRIIFLPKQIRVHYDLIIGFTDDQKYPAKIL